MIRPGPVRIAPLGATALPAVEAVSSAAFDPAYGEAWSKAQCLSVLALPGYRLFGALVPDGPADDEMLAGFAITRSVADESELLLLAVHPARRRAGIATHLLAHWFDAAKQNGTSRVYLEMREDNPARSLYIAHGFREVALRRDYYRGGDGILRNAITMDRSL